jgi:hypothetical protein
MGKGSMKPSHILKIILALVIFSLLTFKAESPRCEPAPAITGIERSQALEDSSRPAKVTDQDRREMDRERFNELEGLIKRALMMRYQQMEHRQDLDESLD